MEKRLILSYYQTVIDGPIKIEGVALHFFHKIDGKDIEFMLQVHTNSVYCKSKVQSGKSALYHAHLTFFQGHLRGRFFQLPDDQEEEAEDEYESNDQEDEDEYEQDDSFDSDESIKPKKRAKKQVIHDSSSDSDLNFWLEEIELLFFFMRL